VAQNKTIEIGRQAVSIDEMRCFFQDNLWGDALPGQDIKQAWFAGSHSDVGGSYPQESSGLSNISLQWMLLQAHEAGIRLTPERVSLVLGESTTAYPACQPLYKRPSSSPVHNSLVGTWWVLEVLPHIYYDKDRGKELHRIPLGAKRQIPDGALVHASVVKRLNDPSAKYLPKNLDPAGLSELADGPKDPAGNPIFYVYRSPTSTLEKNPWIRPTLLWSMSIVEALLGLVVAYFTFRGCGWVLTYLVRALCQWAGC
jgi:hypothetical protein